MVHDSENIFHGFQNKKDRFFIEKQGTLIR